MAQPRVADFTVRLYPLAWRVAAASLVFISRASLPLLLALVVLATDPPIEPLALLQLLVALSGVPAAAAVLLRRARAARVEVCEDDVVVRRTGFTMEIPRGAIARVAPWTVPLPGAGVTLWMRSGKRLRDGFETDDPAALLDALDRAGVMSGAAALQHPSVLFAHAAAATAGWRWYHYLWKFGLFALAPTAVLFNAHQHIAYGGTLGQYYLLGPGAYLRTFLLYWATVAAHLVLFAGLWRAIAEPAALLATWVAPERAMRARRIAEIGCQLLYYAGVPALLAARFLV